MSYTVKGNKVYANINDLPQDYSIKNGDKLIVQRNDETYIVDYGDIKVDLEHVTFSETFTEMLNFTYSCNEFVSEINREFEKISDEVATISSQHTQITARLDAIETILKLIYCCESSKRETQETKNLTEDAKQQFTRLKDSFTELFNDAYPGITFRFEDYNFASRFLS